MGLGPRLDIQVRQQLVMSQQLQVAIKLLAMGHQELEATLAEELAANPLLDRIDGTVIQREDRETGDAPADPATTDQLIAANDSLAPDTLDHDWREAALDTDSRHEIAGGSGEDDGFDFDRLEARQEGLAAHLLAQLDLATPLVEAIIHELEDSGYLLTPLPTIAEAMAVPLREVEAALREVQALDPPGIAARDLAECLALQAKAIDRYDPAMARLIDNLDLLAKGRMADLKRICAVDEEDMADMVRELRAYDPKPGCRFANDPMIGREPDLIVTRLPRGGWRVMLNERLLPRLSIDGARLSAARARCGREGKAFLSERLASAKALVRALDQRASTIQRVGEAIVAAQPAFFQHGVAGLKPMTLAKIAEAIGVHESTVSRVTQHKLLACDHGLYDLKSFFSAGVAAEDGEGAAAAAVKAEIKRLIGAETEILSDDTLVDLLKAKGYDLARRTVAKYREAIGIGSSIERRRQRRMSGS